MLVLLLILAVLAIAGVLGAVLKAVFVLAAALVLAAVIVGWLGWRWLRRQLEPSAGRWEVTSGTTGTTEIRVGKAERPAETADREPPAIDERY